MQLFICAAVVLTSMVLIHTNVEASVSMRVVPANPNHPGKCYDDETNTAHEVNSMWANSASCVRYTCRTGPENNFHIETAGCGIVEAGPPCRVTSGDAGNLYPECCPKIVCPQVTSR